MTERIRSIPQDELATLLARASEEGARKALAAVGLHDEDASNDVRELRSLLEMFRQVRRGAREQIGRTFMRLVLLGLIFLAGWHWPELRKLLP